MTEPANSEASPLKDVQNILGFLIAGFAGILSFIGLRSGEVSAVLRNPETEQPASVIVIVLFLAALTAVLAVALGSSRRMQALWAVPITLALLATGALVMRITILNYNLGTIGSLSVVCLGGLAVLTALWALYAPRRKRSSETDEPRTVQTELICILASVTLLGISVFGAMRVEAKFQSVETIRISASVAEKSSKAAVLSAHLTGSRLLVDRYIQITVYGLPKSLGLCKKTKKCAHETSPCLDSLRARCQLIYGAVVPVDANGQVNYT
jgi:hypothetical protein